MPRSLCVLCQAGVLRPSSVYAWACYLNHAMTVEERS